MLFPSDFICAFIHLLINQTLGVHSNSQRECGLDGTCWTGPQGLGFGPSLSCSQTAHSQLTTDSRASLGGRLLFAQIT